MRLAARVSRRREWEHARGGVEDGPSAQGLWAGNGGFGPRGDSLFLIIILLYLSFFSKFEPQFKF